MKGVVEKNMFGDNGTLIAFYSENLRNEKNVYITEELERNMNSKII